MNIIAEKVSLGKKIGVNFEANESIKWTGKPNLKSHLLNEIRAYIMVLLYSLAGMLVLCLMAYLHMSGIPWSTALSFIGIISVISICRSVWTFLKFRTTTYVITDLSIIIHYPFVYITKIIPIKDIRTKEIKRTFIDKRLNTGTISFYSGCTKENEGIVEKVYDHLNSIEGPSFVYSII